MKTIFLATLFCCSVMSSVYADESQDNESRNYYKEAIAHYAKSEYTEAASDFFRAGLAHSDPVFAYNIGLCYAKLSLYSLARAQFDEYLRFFPVDEAAIRLRDNSAWLGTFWEPVGMFGRAFVPRFHEHASR